MSKVLGAIIVAGATAIGSAVGTLILPGYGTAVGAAIGAGVGSQIATAIAPNLPRPPQAVTPIKMISARSTLDCYEADDDKTVWPQ